MNVTTPRRAALGAAAAAAVLAGVVVAPGAASAATAKNIPVVSAHLGAKTTLSRTHLRPGRVTFEVHSSKGAHTLQIASLHSGYTLAQANQDINAGFEGSAAAISRVDRNVTFKGGSAAKPSRSSRFTIYLSAGSYVAVNFDTGAYQAFTVSGAAVNRKTVRTNSRVVMLTYGFDTQSHLARSGTMRLTNVSDQPHFLVVQRVKPGTTRAMVAKAFQSDVNSQPKFLLPGGTDTSVLSPGKTQAFTYTVPAGKYVIACFWPDDKTGMEHAAMGMFELVTLD